MRIIEEIEYYYSCESLLEEFLRQLSNNCRMMKYDMSVRLIGSSVCKVELSPIREWSLYINSFKPDIHLEIISVSGVLSMHILCKLHKSIRRMNFAFNVLAGLLLTLGTILSKENRFKGFLTGAAGLFLVWAFALGMTVILFELSSNNAVKNLFPEPAKYRVKNSSVGQK